MTGCGAPGAPGIIRCLRKNGERDIRIVAVDRKKRRMRATLVRCILYRSLGGKGGFPSRRAGYLPP